MAELYGIDVSVMQTKVDWDKLAANKDISFVIIRAAQGTAQDSWFARNITECQRVGIPYGLYFASNGSSDTEDEVRAEAEFARLYIRRYKPRYGAWFDMELQAQYNLGEKNVTRLLNLWLDVVQQEDCVCGIYTNLTWLKNRIDDSILDRCALWYAAYPSTAQKKLTEAPKNNREKLSYPMAAIWQWSSKGKVDGITGDVDLNVCYEAFAEPKEDKGYISLSDAKTVLADLGYNGIII